MCCRLVTTGTTAGLDRADLTRRSRGGRPKMLWPSRCAAGASIATRQWVDVAVVREASMLENGKRAKTVRETMSVRLIMQTVEHSIPARRSGTRLTMAEIDLTARLSDRGELADEVVESNGAAQVALDPPPDWHYFTSDGELRSARTCGYTGGAGNRRAGGMMSGMMARVAEACGGVLGGYC